MKAALLFLVAAILLAGCVAPVAVGRYDPTSQSFSGAVVRDGADGCGGVPASFKESDLVGTWWADPGSTRDTTLILRPDHTYLDLYQQVDGTNRYQGTGRERWWVEYRRSGAHLLHLTGMHFCHEDQDKPCSEKGPDRGLWFDFCDKTNVQFHDEVVMLIRPAQLGAQPPRGLWLQYLVAEPDSISSTFILKSENFTYP